MTPARLFFCCLLLISSTGCGDLSRSGSSHQASAGYEPMPPRTARESALVLAARLERAAIDSQVRAAPGNMQLVAGLASGALALVAGPAAWPDSTDVSYNVFSDASGRVRLAFQSPFSQSGDWNLDLSHYFDAREMTFLVERQMSFFNGCWDDSTGSMVPIRETATTYFDSAGRIIARDFVRSTFDDDPIPTKRCNANTTMRPPYEAYPSWDSLASATGLGRLLQAAAH